uniref:p12-9p n=1 Tax=Pyrococcus sp. 12/1 TaxID=758582 RepID=D6MY15_9EURY|nr:hypothetical protein [Pyrococcus sp. 12/1]ADF80216.1 p12-9p [Pyrococcus sp. 12/1]
MGRENIIENIYFAIHKYDSDQNVLNKAMYLSTAVILLKALIQREKLKEEPLRTVWYDPKDEGFKETTFTTNELLRELDKMSQEIAKTLGIINRQEILRTTTGRDHASMVNTLIAMEKVLPKLEAIKQMILEILVLTGYDQVSFAQLEEARIKREEKAQLAQL